MRIGIFTFIICTAFLAGFAAEPASQPATVTPRSMSKDLFHLIDPPSPPWSVIEYKPEADVLGFITDSRDGKMIIALLPKDANVDPGFADNVAVAVVKEIRAERAKAGIKVVMAAKIEKDSRFAVRVHEKYKVGNQTADQLHLYKNVGPRVLMLTVNTVADKPEMVAAEQKAGEDLLLSAKFNRKAFKPDR